MVARNPAPPRPNDEYLHVIVASPYVGSDRLKRICDLVIGTVLFIVALPVIAGTWLAIRLTSSGPGFYSQVRVGRDGRHYRIYKIRTMQHNCERQAGAQWCQTRDPRVTPLGKVLRKLHLDELPQLWNVLRGDMSLVGPRPERPEFVVPLSAEIPGYMHRHLVRPGVTGLAQIQLPADTSVASVRTKLVLDRLYVTDQTLWLDFRILVGTVVYLLGCKYGTVRWLMRLPNPLHHDLKVCDPTPVAQPLADDACVDWVSREVVPSMDDSTVCGKA